jgi:hypothetical protein
MQMKLNAAAIEELSATSAYKAFEQHCCILQKVEPRGLSINERVLFWCNIYNTITGERKDVYDGVQQAWAGIP